MNVGISVSGRSHAGETLPSISRAAQHIAAEEGKKKERRGNRVNKEPRNKEDKDESYTATESLGVHRLCVTIT